MIDYAHTDDALENILKSVKNNAFRKILLVFGAGGGGIKGREKQWLELLRSSLIDASLQPITQEMKTQWISLKILVVTLIKSR